MKEPMFEPYCILLHRRRKEMGFSVRELAMRSGVSPSYISDIETGRRDANDQQLQGLLDALHMHYADIIIHDCRPPVQEIRELCQTDKRYGVAFRTIVTAITNGRWTGKRGRYNRHVQERRIAMSNHIEHERQTYIADFDKINALLCNYAAASSLVATHMRQHTYETDAEKWLQVVNYYREKHREMLNVYRELPSEGILEYMAGDEAVAAYYGELTKGKHCKDCIHHRCSEIGVDRCYFTYPPYDTEAHKQACRCFKPKEGDQQS